MYSTLDIEKTIVRKTKSEVNPVIIKCPVCNQDMQLVEQKEYEEGTDSYFCAGCQTEQTIDRKSGEATVSQRE